MNERQTNKTTKAASSRGGPDDSEPSLVRQAELRAAYEANVASGKAPYEGVAIRTLGELHWILDERGWLEELRAYTTFHPETANLSRADLRGTNLSGVRLIVPDLSGALLQGANLSDASLRSANLAGAWLSHADLRGTDLSGVRMDAATALNDVQLNPVTLLGDVVWNGASLAATDWGQIPILGDELSIADEPNRVGLVAACHSAARAYRGLSLALRTQGLMHEASRYRLRELRLERRALREERKLRTLLSAFASWLLDLTSGYGEQPWKPFVAYLTVILTFWGLYAGVAHVHDSRLLQVAWWEWPALSISAFHGRGFFPGTLPQPPSGWITLFALLEAVIGLFIELVFVATFTRRFLGN